MFSCIAVLPHSPGVVYYHLWSIGTDGVILKGKVIKCNVEHLSCFLFGCCKDFNLKKVVIIAIL